MQFNKEDFNSFRTEIEKAVKGVEYKFQVKIEFGNISYQEECFDIKCKVSRTDIDIDKVIWDKYCEIYGLHSEDYKKIVNIDGERFQLSGIDMKKRKYPIVATNVLNGKSYGLNPISILSKLQIDQ